MKDRQIGVVVVAGMLSLMAVLLLVV